MAIRFETMSHAKCIFAGEHAVLRGSPALILPIAAKTLTLTYEPGAEDVELQVESKYQEVLLTIFWATLRECLKTVNRDMSVIKGRFTIHNKIEMGAGLGFSAALCVVLTRWLIWKKWVEQKDLFRFAHQLEHAFHGTSSGVDIAGVMTNHLLHYETTGVLREVNITWHPHLYLSYSGLIKSTDQAIKKVSDLHVTNPEMAKTIDVKMQESVLSMEKALNMNQQTGYELLVKAINQANECFQQWGLISNSMQDHMTKLNELGAVAMKPTGAGDGGYVLSLWEQKPPEIEHHKLTPLFKESI